ncbi:MAG: hypothetical protein CSA62_04475 [Planctomycetota bacterium]|nr:MAG: hypothetical protein CSA62_04475 [Planctomycetota bacterium]
MKSHNFAALLLLPTLLAGAPELLAQGAPPGYRSYDNALAPIRFYYPIRYKVLPLPPTEKVLIARYLQHRPPQELSKAEKKNFKGQEPRVYAFFFEAKPVTTQEEKNNKKDKAPRSVREAMEARSSVASWGEFKSKRLKGWRVEPVRRKEMHYELSFPSKLPKEKAKRRGYLVLKRKGRKVMGVFGHSFPAHYKRQRKEIIKMSWGLDLWKERKQNYRNAQLDRMYQGKDYKGIERRKKVRREMSKGWKALDTEHFILVYDTRDKGLVHRIARDIEAMRKVYKEIFPPEHPIDAVSIVRICKNKTEYHQYGGPSGSGGFWHPGNEELVFFDYDQEQREKTQKERKKQRRRLTDKDSLLVLYHEAFHQFIHYSIGEFSPHDWFNEGFGDYFSGAVISKYKKTVKVIGPSPWRINLAKNQCEFRHGFVPLSRLLKAERGEFYHPARRGLYYAAAWSFIYFLRNSDKVAKHPKWSKLLMTYFESIKKHYKAEIAKAGKDPSLKAKHRASALARVAAVKDATAGIDLKKLESAWREYIVKMHNPWRSQRVIPKKYRKGK